MNLQFVYDPSVANAPAGFQDALNLVAQYLDAAIPNAGTITIRVGWGEINDVTVTSLANSSTDALIPVTYQQLQGAIPSLPSADPYVGTQYFLPDAQAVLLDLAPNAGDVGAVGFNSTVQYNFDHSATPNTFDFIGVALHEITEVLGRQDFFEDFVNAVSEYDVYRVHQNGNAYFSLDGGHTLINEFSTVGDPGDWIQQDDSFAAKTNGPGHELFISEGDQLAIDSLFGTHRTPEVFANQPGSIALAVENEMYGVIGTQGEVELLTTQFLPPQLAHAQQLGFNTTAYGTEALGLVFAFGNETGSHAFENNYGPSAIPNTAAGDHQFADLVAHQVFGASTTPNTVDVVSTWVSNWKAFFTTYGISGIAHPTADQIDLAARGTAFGDAVGVALDNNINGIHDLTNNFLGVASHGTGVYSAPLALQPEYNPLLMV
jgi:hypothetical protein